MSQPSRDAMFERVMDEVARHYRHSDIVLFEDDVKVKGRVRAGNEHVVWINITGPVKKEVVHG